MQIYLYDEAGWYIGADQAQPDPLEADHWLYPSKSSFDAPPEPGEKTSPRWVDGAWVLETDPQKLTRQERIEGGFEERPAGSIVEGDEVRPATPAERVSLGEISAAEAYQLELAQCLNSRRQAYELEADPIRAQALDGESQPDGSPYTMAMVATIKADIRARFPKPTSPA